MRDDADRSGGDRDDLDPATDAFAEYLARLDDGDAPPFDAYCAEHPGLGAQLRKLHDDWQALSAAFVDAGDARVPPPPSGDADPDHERSDVELVDGTASRSTLLRNLLREDAELPRYEKAGEIARGGMAAILRARDNCLRRTLAMKVLLDDNAALGAAEHDPHTLARFIEEAQITGQLDHPGIPPVHELGIDGTGRVFFTMPLIRGRNLSEVFAMARADRDGWNLTRAVDCLRRVCDTIAYAHSRGVVHRDLKPSNVMVGRFGEVYVMDWGLAQVRGRRSPPPGASEAMAESSIRTVRSGEAGDGAESPLVTLDGQVVGTPAYMAPEQARGEPGAVGPWSDVYSIGAMLYELLAGQAPFVPPGARVSARTVLLRLLEGPPSALQPAKDRPDELIAICMRAMAREPQARYLGASDLAADLRAWLEGRVVRAHTTGPWAELRKWIGRNRALAAACSAAVVAMAFGLVITFVLGREARLAANGLAIELRANTIERGRLSAASGNTDQAERLLWPEHVRTPTAAETFWALWDLHVRNPSTATVDFDAELRRGVRLSGSGQLVVADARGRLHFLDATSLELRATLPAPEASPATAIAADEAGFVFTAHESGALVVVDADRRSALRILRTSSRVNDMAFDPTHRRLLCGCVDGSVLLYDTTTWEMRQPVPPAPGTIRRVAWSPDGARFATAAADMVARVHATSTGELLASCRAGDALSCLAFRTSDELLVAGQERVLQTLDLTAPEAAAVTIARKPDTFSSITITGNPSRLVVCGWQRLELWDLPGLEVRRVIDLPSAPVSGTVLVDLQGRQAVTVHTNEVRAWDLADQGRHVLPGHEGRVVTAMHPDGGSVITGDGAGVLRRYALAASSPPTELGRHAGRVRSMAISPDGSLLLSGGADNLLQVRDAASGELRRSFADHDDTSQYSMCFSPDGSRFASAVRQGSRTAVVVHDARTLATLATISTGRSQVIALAFSPNGERLAASCRGRGVLLFDRDGNQLRELTTVEQCWSLAFREDGKQLAVGTWGKVIEVFDPDTGTRVATLEGHSGTVWSVGWLPGATPLLRSAAADGRFKIWSVADERQLLSCEPFGNGLDVLAVSASRSGRHIALAGASPVVVVWDMDHYARLVASNVGAWCRRSGLPPEATAAAREWATAVLTRAPR